MTLAMSEKSLPPSRLLLSLTMFSMFFLGISSFFLFISTNDSPLPASLIRNREIEDTPLSNPDKSNLNEEVDTLSVKNEGCNPSNALLRVYMYDLSPQFHFGLLGWNPQSNETWPNIMDPAKIPRYPGGLNLQYPGGLNLQHSIEFWLTLDLLSSNVKGVVRPCTVFRVAHPNEADFVFVPFFASLSYNRYSKVQGKHKNSLNKKLQHQLVKFLMKQPEWKMSQGKDHILVPHHPNSMLYGRRMLGSARFVLADFGRYDAKMANLEKDMIAPYKHVVKSISSEHSAPFELRPTLMYFQGAIYRKDGGTIRHELYYLLKEEKDVHFTFGSVQRNGIRQAGQGMGSSKFCLNIAGDTPSSNRLFDAIVSHCVPVIISDDIELPYEDVLNYSDFCIFVWSSDAVKPGFLLKLLRNIKSDEWTSMWERLKEVAHHFEYQFPSQPGDAVDMIWQAFDRKKSNVKMNRTKRMYRTPHILREDT